MIGKTNKVSVKIKIMTVFGIMSVLAIWRQTVPCGECLNASHVGGTASVKVDDERRHHHPGKSAC